MAQYRNIRQLVLLNKMMHILRHRLISHGGCVGGSAVVSQVKCIDGTVQVFHEGFSKRREVFL